MVHAVMQLHEYFSCLYLFGNDLVYGTVFLLHCEHQFNNKVKTFLFNV